MALGQLGPGATHVGKIEQRADQKIEFSFDHLLDVHEVAELLGVPASWVYKNVRRPGANRLPVIRVGKYLRFVEADVRTWIERMRRA
jgi:excisionase family DNA binding protein